MRRIVGQLVNTHVKKLESKKGNVVVADSKIHFTSDLHFGHKLAAKIQDDESGLFEELDQAEKRVDDASDRLRKQLEITTEVLSKMNRREMDGTVWRQKGRM